MFDPDLYGENSWEKLKGMLTKVGCVSGCSVVIRDSCQNKTTNQKATYLLCCSHGLLVEENGLIEYDGDNVGPHNVIKEHLKRVKTTGHSKKGKQRNMCTTCLLNQNCINSICTLPILIEPNFIFSICIISFCIKEQRDWHARRRKLKLRRKKLWSMSIR
jgi:hypothetical protein